MVNLLRTENRPKQGSYKPRPSRSSEREETWRVSLAKWKVTICSCPRRKRQTLPSCCGILEPIFFKRGPKRSVPLLFPFAAPVRATHEKHVHKTVCMSANVQSLRRLSCSLCQWDLVGTFPPSSHANMQGRIDDPNGVPLSSLSITCSVTFISYYSEMISMFREKASLTYLEVIRFSMQLICFNLRLTLYKETALFNLWSIFN